MFTFENGFKREDPVKGDFDCDFSYFISEIYFRANVFETWKEKNQVKREFWYFMIYITITEDI